MYLENPEGTRVIIGSMNMGYDIHSTLLGLELATWGIRIAEELEHIAKWAHDNNLKAQQKQDQGDCCP